MNGVLADEDLDIPFHMIPPNPEESESERRTRLPSQVHPSYPYGNPTSVKHPSLKPRPTHDPGSRALFEDMGYAGGGINGNLRWRDLGLDDLLPVDEEKEEAKRAMQARKMASGASNNNPQAQQQHAPQVQQNQMEDEDEDEDDEDDEDENDENETGDFEEEEDEEEEAEDTEPEED
ncbi:hypothetical protein BDN70DRAFT_874784 [Pholiota conissans]|uniref:Uncharacterized protein n=1 Tax=Pholiota conissans TaxID=109636 RepID=A0A9P5Z9V0_9AGAR|nr:hypothetical protein BDN70DRAFT_874784 [Pholiota conissans]